MQANGALKRALLMGAGWTLAAAVALACFKSSAFGPISLGTLGIVALGWAGVLLYAIASEQRAAGAALVAAGGETAAVIEGLAQLAARVWRLLLELEQAKAASPPRQKLMHAGEVELV